MSEADVSALFSVQLRSYQTAGPGIRESYPQKMSMDAAGLAVFLDSRRYGVLATARSDGRPHATPIAFCVWDRAFWVASARGARLRNLRANLSASIVIMEGEDEAHRAVIAEGPVTLHPTGTLQTMPAAFQALVQKRLGDVIAWATALIELRPERLFSYDASKKETL